MIKFLLKILLIILSLLSSTLLVNQLHAQIQLGETTNTYQQVVEQKALDWLGLQESQQRPWAITSIVFNEQLPALPAWLEAQSDDPTISNNLKEYPITQLLNDYDAQKPGNLPYLSYILSEILLATQMPGFHDTTPFDYVFIVDQNNQPLQKPDFDKVEDIDKLYEYLYSIQLATKLTWLSIILKISDPSIKAQFITKLIETLQLINDPTVHYLRFELIKNEMIECYNLESCLVIIQQLESLINKAPDVLLDQEIDQKLRHRISENIPSHFLAKFLIHRFELAQSLARFFDISQIHDPSMQGRPYPLHEFHEQELKAIFAKADENLKNFWSNEDYRNNQVLLDHIILLDKAYAGKITYQDLNKPLDEDNTQARELLNVYDLLLERAKAKEESIREKLEQNRQLSLTEEAALSTLNHHYSYELFAQFISSSYQFERDTLDIYTLYTQHLIQRNHMNFNQNGQNDDQQSGSLIAQLEKATTDIDSLLHNKNWTVKKILIFLSQFASYELTLPEGWRWHRLIKTYLNICYDHIDQLSAGQNKNYFLLQLDQIQRINDAIWGQRQNIQEMILNHLSTIKQNNGSTLRTPIEQLFFDNNDHSMPKELREAYAGKYLTGFNSMYWQLKRLLGDLMKVDNIHLKLADRNSNWDRNEFEHLSQEAQVARYQFLQNYLELLCYGMWIPDQNLINLAKQSGHEQLTAEVFQKWFQNRSQNLTAISIPIYFGDQEFELLKACSGQHDRIPQNVNKYLYYMATKDLPKFDNNSLVEKITGAPLEVWLKEGGPLVADVMITLGASYGSHLAVDGVRSGVNTVRSKFIYNSIKKSTPAVARGIRGALARAGHWSIKKGVPYLSQQMLALSFFILIRKTASYGLYLTGSPYLGGEKFWMDIDNKESISGLDIWHNFGAEIAFGGPYFLLGPLAQRLSVRIGARLAGLSKLSAQELNYRMITRQLTIGQEAALTASSISGTMGIFMGVPFINRGVQRYVFNDKRVFILPTQEELLNEIGQAALFTFAFQAYGDLVSARFQRKNLGLETLPEPMMETRNLYTLLGLSRSDAQLQGEAFVRRLNERWMEIQHQLHGEQYQNAYRAYLTLRDPQKRAEFDQSSDARSGYIPGRWVNGPKSYFAFAQDLRILWLKSKATILRKK